MPTVLSHFYNEEQLLPFWLKHHTKIFEHGLLIDYGSTDSSVEIIRELAPNWEVVSSYNQYFGAEAVDEEVMFYERQISGWKICLNTTEFVVCSNLEESLNGSALQFKGYEIIDNYWQKICDPNPDLPLIAQRYFGHRSPGRDRLIHCHADGRYTAGRHWSAHHPTIHVPDGLLFWYSWSPMTIQTQRKLQISDRIPSTDRAKGFGVQHWDLTLEKIEKRWSHQHSMTRNLSRNKSVAKSLRSCLRQIQCLKALY